MGPNEKIGRSIQNMLDMIKDSVSAKISEAAASGRIKIDQASVPIMIAMVTSTIDAGYHQAARVLDREIAAITSVAVEKSNTKSTGGKKK